MICCGRIIAHALVGIVLLVASAGAAPIFYGDLDGTGGPSAGDVVRLVNHLNGSDPLGPDEPQADVNQDGSVNMADLDAMIDAILGLDSYTLTPAGVDLLSGNKTGTLLRAAGAVVEGSGPATGAVPILVEIQPGDPPQATLRSETVISNNPANEVLTGNPLYFPPGIYNSSLILDDPRGTVVMIFNYVTPAAETGFGRDLTRTLVLVGNLEGDVSLTLEGEFTEFITGALGRGVTTTLRGEFRLGLGTAP